MLSSLEDSSPFIQVFAAWIMMRNTQAAYSADVHRQPPLAVASVSSLVVPVAPPHVQFLRGILSIYQWSHPCHRPHWTTSLLPPPQTFRTAQESTEALRLTTITDRKAAPVCVHIQVTHETWLLKIIICISSFAISRPALRSLFSSYLSRWFKQHWPALIRFCDLFRKDEQLNDWITAFFSFSLIFFVISQRIAQASTTSIRNVIFT